MKQTTTTTTEKLDPLMRIQEEIKEVVRREQEYHRQLSSGGVVLGHSEDEEEELNGNVVINETVTYNNNKNVHTVTATPLLLTQEDSSLNTLSLVSSNDGHHSDDSGISASSSPVNGSSVYKAKQQQQEQLNAPSTPSVQLKEPRYIGPNCYKLTPEPPQQLMTPAISSNNFNKTKPRLAFNSAHKGVMQRFIASRGKLQLSPSSPLATNSNHIMLNGKSAAALLGVSTPTTPPNTPMGAALNSTLVAEFTRTSAASMSMPMDSMTPAVIERDSEGRPIRPGYVPVELRIQRELKDLKSRESELKKIRKIRQSTSDLLSIDNNDETDEDDAEIEHCYGPGKLRTAKSIDFIADTNLLDNSIQSSFFDRTTPSPDFDRFNSHRNNVGGMRPAMSLAQLCDLDPEEAPSSHRLIAQWENIIQQNA